MDTTVTPSISPQPGISTTSQPDSVSAAIDRDAIAFHAFVEGATSGCRMAPVIEYRDGHGLIEYPAGADVHKMHSLGLGLMNLTGVVRVEQFFENRSGRASTTLIHEKSY